MTQRLLMTLAFATLLGGTAAPALAAPDSYVIDPTHTSVIFSVNHGGWANVYGRFRTLSGTMKFDEKNVAASAVAVTIDANSVDTNHDKRNASLKSPDFLNTAEFDQIKFVSTKIEKTGDNKGRITGNLTLIGVTRPVVLDVTYNRTGFDKIMNKTKAGFSATTVIDRSQFGMKYGLPHLGNDIKVTLEVEAIKQ